MIFGVIFLSLLIGIIYAIVQYYKESKSSFSKKQKIILSIIRIAAVAIICIVIAALFFKNTHTYKEKPIVVILQDNSKSLILNPDSAFYQNEYIEIIDDLSTKLKQVADVHCFSFDNDIGEGIAYSFSGQQTNISKALDEILIRYENRNICGLVLATDGISNAGFDISNYADKFNFPVHTIALGDTGQKPDLLIKNIVYNKTVAYDNRFPIEILVQANQLQNKKTVLQVLQDGNEVSSKEISINSHRFSEQSTVMIHADKKGLIKFDISLKPINDEENTYNNKTSIIVEVVDKKDKICVLYANSHPDISAIISAIEESKTIEVESFNIKDFNQSNINKYDAFVLFQIPSKLYNSTELISQLNKYNKAITYTLGLQSNINDFNRLNTGVQIISQKNQIQEIIPSFNPNFTSFILSDEAQKAIDKFPPLSTYFAQYKTNDIVQVFINQKIGNINTNNPLVAYNKSEMQNIGIILGEGIFKWKIHSYLQFQTHSVFNELISKMLSVVLQKSNKEQFRVFHKDIYFDNENVIFTAETYNLSMEMLGGVPINLQIVNSEGKQIEMPFTSLLKNYRLDLGLLEAGKYKWSADAMIDGQKHQVSGLFFVENLNIEAIDLNARHHELIHLSNSTQGIFSYPEKESVNKIIENIKSNPNLKTIEYLIEKFDELISLKILAFLIVILLSTEWALRKYFGYY